MNGTGDTYNDGYESGERNGRDSEKRRLGPLLRLCLELVEALIEETDRPFMAEKANVVSGNLRRELGIVDERMEVTRA